MAKTVILFCMLCLAAPTPGQLRRPFPAGRSMGDLGAILWTDGASGRQAWVPASFTIDTVRLGFSAYGVLYYDKMDNMSGDQLFQSGAGGFLSAHGFTCKLSTSLFNAFGLYREIGAMFSCGYSLSYAASSVEIRGYRIDVPFDMRQFSTLSATLLIPFPLLSVSITGENLWVSPGGDIGGLAPEPVARLGLHTSHSRYGAQGLLVEVSPLQKSPVRIIVGEEYRFIDGFGITAAIASNPLYVAAGVVIETGKIAGAGALVNHPKLGWSKGVSIDYVP